MESHCFYAGVHDQNDETNLLQLLVRSESLHNFFPSSARSNNIGSTSVRLIHLQILWILKSFYTKIHHTVAKEENLFPAGRRISWALAWTWSSSSAAANDKHGTINIWETPHERRTEKESRHLGTSLRTKLRSKKFSFRKPLVLQWLHCLIDYFLWWTIFIVD